MKGTIKFKRGSGAAVAGNSFNVAREFQMPAAWFVSSAVLLCSSFVICTYGMHR